MAMMAKMRSLAPAFILTVGVLFVLFMVVSSSNVMDALGGRSNIIGKVNGDEITYQEFSKAVEQQRENEKNQKGKDVADEDMDKLRNQVWDAVVMDKLIGQYVEKFNITVSNQEIKDIILNNPPDFLKKSFIDSTGKFNKQAYESAIIDPRNNNVMVQAEDIVRQQRLRAKLQSELLASLTVGEPEIRRKFIDENIKIDVKYALVPLTEFPDSSIKVTDDELRDYYNKHIDDYKIVPKRRVKYVLFSSQPSAEDTQIVVKNLENVYKDLQKDTSSFKSYVDIYSTVPYSKDTVSLDLLPEKAADLIANAKSGQIIGPLGTSQGYAIYHIVKILPSNKTVVKVSHILIPAQVKNNEESLKKANEIYNQLQKGANFAQLAKQYSEDPGSKNKGGDLGWFGKGRMIPEFEKAAFSGKVGEILKPVKTNYGYHIIKVTGRSDKKYVIEKIMNPVTESAATKDARYNAASDFSYLAQKNDFEGEAKLEKLTIKESTPFVKDAAYITGIGANKRLTDFAFNNSVGTVSDVFKVQNGYLVAQVSQITNAGVLSYDEVKNRIKPMVINEKKYSEAKKVAEKIRNAINGDIDKSSQIDPKAIVNKTGSFLAGAISIPTVGRDYAFLGEALRLDTTKISEPVKGIHGYYLMKILNRTKFDSSAYAAKRTVIMNQILSQKRNTFFSQWVSEIKKDADIVDNRYKFYNR